ncbi:MAG TPA: indole-3-glycerol phosphate synthase TrpC [Micavibrio sp.]|nr:indole-3-glycerol phosphate synthase TrpC [Micavibrio sp.]HIL28758.1 indole-3-glycerol phosphate synthase TrpC [Micavibrio sp.]
MSVLNEICTKKQDHVEACKSQRPLTEVITESKNNKTQQRFRKRILDKASSNKVALIAEVKKASPSHGLIREDFDPVKIARIYSESGAACLSVLTDVPYFQGHDTYLQEIRQATDLPLLRKDFMIDPYQIYESRILGADCILLIMAALSDTQAEEMSGIASELGMDTLCEVHDEEELQRAIDLKFNMIGINNRNLKTLDVSLERGLAMAKDLPPDVTRIAESGIHKHEHITMYQSAGFHGFLVGESLMRQPDIATATKTLLGNT